MASRNLRILANLSFSFGASRLCIPFHSPRILNRATSSTSQNLFRCVSKSLHTDPHLSLLQLDRTASTDRPFLVISRSRNYRFDLDSIDDENAKLEEIQNPWINEKASVVGSCHGLLALQQQLSRRIAVLNPTTREHHLVPPNPSGDNHCFGTSFGYDQVHDRYKLVTRVCTYCGVELMIYDVNNGAWRKSKFDDLHLDYYWSYSKGIYIDGALYWSDDSIYSRYRNTNTIKIIRFVLAEEQFEEVEPPKFGGNDIATYSQNITVFDGRLCMICVDHPKPNARHTLEFWLMEEELDERQVGSSSYARRWTKFLSLRDPGPHLPRVPILVPICFSACRTKSCS